MNQRSIIVIAVGAAVLYMGLRGRQNAMAEAQARSVWVNYAPAGAKSRSVQRTNLGGPSRPSPTSGPGVILDPVERQGSQQLWL